MESYDAIYRHLRAEGHEAWTGNGYQRARQQLNWLDALIVEIADAGFMLIERRVNVNPWWDHATLVYHKALSPPKVQACF